MGDVLPADARDQLYEAMSALKPPIGARRVEELADAALTVVRRWLAEQVEGSPEWHARNHASTFDRLFNPISSYKACAWEVCADYREELAVQTNALIRPPLRPVTESSEDGEPRG